jgi:hypothetical protein
VSVELGPVHDFDGLARKSAYGLNGPTGLGGRSVAVVAQHGLLAQPRSGGYKVRASRV